MPTVLDTLRHYILGDDAADKLELAVDILTAQAFGRAGLPSEQATSSLPSVIADICTPSAGYEPLLIQMGYDSMAARAIAHFAVRRGRQHAAESKLSAQVLQDIRFLAKGSRRRDAIIRCARRLHDAWEKNRIVGDLLFEANVEDFEIMSMLKSASKGDLSRIDRVFEIAAGAAPRLSSKRGPKISAASATHEFFIDNNLGISNAPWPKNLENRRAEYVDSLTAATRKEFKSAEFDPRSAKRRVRQASEITS